MENYECLDKINLSFDWKKLFCEQPAISITKIDRNIDTEKLYLPWYNCKKCNSSIDTQVDYKHILAEKVTVKFVIDNFNHWTNCNQKSKVSNYENEFKTSSKLIHFRIPVYGLCDSSYLILDGNHRMVALIKSEVEFAVELLIIKGSINSKICPDLKFHNNSS